MSTSTAERPWRRSVALLACLFVLGFALPARAQPDPADPADPAPDAAEQSPDPWAEGVSDAHKAEAERLLAGGNALFVDGKYGEALKAYREALASWDHPAIRFNVVRCLINLGQPVEAYENLTQALEYGEAPFESGRYADAKDYERQLLGQIATLQVTCDEAGAVVTLDGKVLMTCPSQTSRLLEPGEHQIVARKAGYLTDTQSVVLLPGKPNVVTIAMVSLEDAATTTRRWDSWKPYAVIGTGVAIAALGVPLQLKARSDFHAYDAGVAQECGDLGCAPGELSPSTRNLESQARLENRIAITSFAIGGAVAAAGVALMVLNRPRTVLPENLDLAPESPTVTVVPLLSPDGAGVSVGVQF